MTPLRLARDAAARGEKPLPGDRCQVHGCGGQIVIYSTRLSQGWRIRYMWCEKCHTKPGKNRGDNKWVTAEESDD